MLLNLACGTTIEKDWVNVDWSPYALLAKHRLLARGLRIVGLLNNARWQRLRDLDGSHVLRYDVRKRLPFADEIFEAVYHCHFLEHLSPRDAVSFTAECRRVLRHGGILRVVVPDWAYYAKLYCSASSASDKAAAIGQTIEQMMDHQEHSSSSLRMKLADKLFRMTSVGNGYKHRWMYDGDTLKAFLAENGFREARTVAYDESAIPQWSSYRLDINADGSIRRPDSVFVEAWK